jgi:rhodanese-related sulfurtransferase
MLVRRGPGGAVEATCPLPQKKLGEHVKIIDVREPHEVAATGPLTDRALNVPLGVVPQAFDTVVTTDEDFLFTFAHARPGKSETVVFSCKGGVRSARAAQIAEQLGYAKVYNNIDGADGWFRSQR